jgi:hypothetical protein
MTGAKEPIQSISISSKSVFQHELLKPGHHPQHKSKQYPTRIYQGSFFGVRIRFLASEGASLHKYTNQSQSLCILQPEKRTLEFTAGSKRERINTRPIHQQVTLPQLSPNLHELLK